MSSEIEEKIEEEIESRIVHLQCLRLRARTAADLRRLESDLRDPDYSVASIFLRTPPEDYDDGEDRRTEMVYIPVHFLRAVGPVLLAAAAEIEREIRVELGT